ncbi:hypothetical protein FPV67DRAFT_1775657 [Lyophyllum atratum]|nr:hypothetical protein FPV67DRAFT_1775657 [Lyophyllum atratum]
MAVFGTRPSSAPFSSIHQLVSSSGPSTPRLTDFDSMEDIHDFARFAATSSSESISDTGHSFSSRNSASSTAHSFHSPLLRSTSFQSNAEFRSDPRAPPVPNHPFKRKEKRPGRSSLGRSAEHNYPTEVTNQRSMPSPKLPTRSKSYNGNTFRHSAPHGGLGKSKPKRLAAVYETLSASATAVNASLAPSNDNPSSLSSTPTTPRTPSFAPSSSRHSPDDAGSHARRKSLDLGPSRVQAGIRRLKRSPSMWTVHTGDRPKTAGAETRDHIQNLRAEPQLSEQQKLIIVKRARKITQQTIATAIHLSTILSTDAPPSLESTRRRSNSTSSASVGESRRRTSNINASSNQTDSSSRPLSEQMATESADISTPHSPTSDTTQFRDRRRRAAKLTQFFGVSYQDISQSISQTFVLPPTPKQDAAAMPMVEVDVKVAERRFWGLADGEMKNAEVADVINKLRGLKAA